MSEFQKCHFLSPLSLGVYFSIELLQGGSLAFARIHCQNSQNEQQKWVEFINCVKSFPG